WVRAVLRHAQHLGPPERYGSRASIVEWEIRQVMPRSLARADRGADAPRADRGRTRRGAPQRRMAPRGLGRSAASGRGVAVRLLGRPVVAVEPVLHLVDQVLGLVLGGLEALLGL